MNLPLTTGAAMIVIVTYLSFTAIAAYVYPLPWDPSRTFLSDFGNMRVNVRGSGYFNAGTIITGLAVIPLYVGLKDWYSDGRSKYILILGQLAGIASGVALVLIGVYPEDFPAQHRFWSYAFFTINFVAMFLTNTALFMDKKYSSRVVASTYLGQAVTAVYFMLYGGTPLIEWFTVAASLIYAALLAVETWWHENPR